MSEQLLLVSKATDCCAPSYLVREAKKILDQLQLNEAGVTSDQATRDSYLSHEVAPK